MDQRRGEVDLEEGTFDQARNCEARVTASKNMAVFKSYGMIWSIIKCQGRVKKWKTKFTTTKGSKE
jgi:hypothetical protein